MFPETGTRGSADGAGGPAASLWAWPPGAENAAVHAVASAGRAGFPASPCGAACGRLGLVAERDARPRSSRGGAGGGYTAGAAGFSGVWRDASAAPRERQSLPWPLGTRARWAEAADGAAGRGAEIAVLKS